MLFRSANLAAAEAARNAEREKYVSALHRAGSSLDGDDIEGLRRNLTDCPTGFRQWEWGWLKRVAHMETAIVREVGAPVLAVAWDPKDDFVWYASRNRLTPWRPERGRDAGVMLPFEQSVVGLAPTPDGRFLVASFGSFVRVYLRGKGSETVEYRDIDAGQLRNTTATCLAIRPDSGQLAVGCQDGSARLFSIPDFDPQGSADLKIRSLRMLEYSPDGDRLLAVGAAGQVRVAQAYAADRPKFSRPRGNVGAILCASFSPDGKSIATGGTDRIVRIFDAKDMTERTMLAGHAVGVNRLAWFPDGKRLASIGERLIVWDAKAGVALQELRGHRFEKIGRASCRERV